MSKDSLQCLSVRIPASILRDVETIALGAGRTYDAVVRRALEFYLDQEGRDLLAVMDGRRQLDEGLYEDLDDVIADIDRAVTGYVE